MWKVLTSLFAALSGALVTIVVYACIEWRHQHLHGYNTMGWGSEGLLAYVAAFPFLACVVLTVVCRVKDKSNRPRYLCSSCGYDRRGLAGDAKCPECGEGSAPIK